MERVKFIIKKSPFYTWNTDLHLSHMNYGNHLANDKVLTLCHEARVRWLRELQHTELDIYGKGLIQSDAMVMYRSQAFAGDKITIELSLGDINKKAFELYYRINHVGQPVEIARVKTGMISFDYATNMICDFDSKFLSYLKGQDKC